MVRKVLKVLIVLAIMIQPVMIPVLAVQANEIIADEFSEAGHSANDLDSWDPSGNLADDVTPYNYGDDDPEDDWYGVDDDQMEYESFRPYYLEPVARMSDAEIAVFANVQIGFDAEGNEVPVHDIGNPDQLRAFLSGTLGENHHHFRLTEPITLNTETQTNAATTLTTGRPGIFTGVFDGGGNTITGLRLRSGRTANNSLAAGFVAAQDGQIGVGLVQTAGHGAVIRNLNIASPGNSGHPAIANAAAATTQAMALANTGFAYFTSAHNRNVGGFIGATVQNEPGIESVVTLQNVHLVGVTNRMTLQYRVNGISPAAQRTSQGSWGGMVGRVQTGTTLNITDATISNIQIQVWHPATGGRPTHEVRAISQAGGMVGSVHGGRLNITSSVNPTTNQQNINTVDADMRSATRGGTNVAAASTHARYTGINTAGGIVGNVDRGHVHIEHTNVTSRRTNHDPIRARMQGGGIIGNTNLQTSVSLYNVQNAAMIQVNLAGGENSTNGRAGGLIGRAMGAVRIENSRNLGVVQGQANHQTLGGLIGYTGPSSSIHILGSMNGQVGGGFNLLQLPHGVTSNVCGSNEQMWCGATAGLIRHINNSGGHTGANIAGVPNQTAATMGGIIGRSRGRLVIEETENHGHVHKAALNTGSASRRNTRLGGIVGRINPVGGQFVTLNEVENFGHIQLGQTRTETIIGGIVGEIMAPPRGQATITIDDAVNRGTVTGGAHSGGIVGWTRARGVVITDAENHGLIARNTALTHPQDSGGIIGRAGAADLRIINPINHADITPGTGAQRGGYHAGGVIGRSSGANLYIENAYNTGNVRGHANVAGVVGFADGNDARIERAVNRGHHHASRNAGHTTAAGIVGRARRRNMQIREAGNFGNMTMQGGNNVQDGVAGIMGRNDGANGVVQDSFNVGNITGRNTAGGIVGRNSGNLNITNVYNIGYVSNFGRTNAGALGTTGGQNVRSGSGILGRRTSGNVRITNAFVSARVGGFAVGVHTGGNGVLQANGAVTGITFNNVFVDQNAFYSEGTGFQPNNPASQVNRPGIFLVDTEMLTSGFLPGISGGPWSIGINDVHPDLQRTYPFLTWQAPDGQEQFFDSIRSTNTVADVTAPRPVMDMQVQATTNRPVTFDFGGRPTAGVRHFNNYIHIDRISSGNVPVTGNTLALTRPLTRPAGIVMPPVDNVNRSSIGLISPLGIVGFETREVSGRLVVRGFDPEFGTDANRYYISHARFEVVSDDSVLRDEIRLNEEFRAAPGAPDEMRGMGVIAYVVDENQPLVVERGLNPRPGGYTGDVASDIADVTNSTTLANYTVIRITALGYEPTYRIIRQDDLVALSTGTISVPMERIPFEIRTWVPQTSELETADSELEVGPPGTATPGVPPHGAQEGFGTLPNHAPGSHLALDPVLDITTTPHNQTRGGQNVTLDTPTTGGLLGTIGHFAVTTVVWGDELTATGRHHTTNTINELRFTDLFDRGVSTWDTADEERIRVLDIDMYIDNTGLETIFVRFVHLTPNYQAEYDATGELPTDPQFRILNIDGAGTTAQNPQPRIQLTFPNEPNAVVTPMNAPAGVHHPIYAFSNNANPANAQVQNQLQALQNETSAARPALNTLTRNLNTLTPHFRVEGLTRDAILNVVDLDDNFIALEGAELEDFLEYFYGLTNYEARQEAGHGELLTFTNTANSGAGNTARQTQVTNAIYGGGTGTAEHSASRASGVLNRTITIPLRQVRIVPVRVVQQLPDGTYVDINDATLTHNGQNVNRSEDGTFIFRDSGVGNQLIADGGGQFYDHDGFNAHSEEIDGILCDEYEMRQVPEAAANSVEVWTCIVPRPYIRIVLTPSPDPVYVTVTFDLDGGVAGAVGDADRFDSQTFRLGEIATRPTPDPVRAGYEFQHWVERVMVGCLDEEGDDWFVSFDAQDCENPNYDYFLWDFNTPVTRDKYLVATWIPMHQVRFVPGVNGTLSTSSHISLIRDGETIGEDGFVSGQIPNAGHRFSHWTSDSHEGTFTTGEIRNVPITADTIFTAHFVVLQFRVTFNLGDGQPAPNAPAGQFDDQLVDWNTPATNPTADPLPHPVHPEGYIFANWAIRTQTTLPGEYIDEVYVPGDVVYTYTIWDFNTPITEDTELFAIGSNLNRVTFVAGAGGTLSTDEDFRLFKQDGENLTGAYMLPQPLVTEAYHFLYWTSNSHVIRTCPIVEDEQLEDCDDSVAIIEPRRFYSEQDLRTAVITEDTIFTAHFERLTLQIFFQVEILEHEPGVFVTHGTLTGQPEWTVPAYTYLGDEGVVVPTITAFHGFAFSHWVSNCSMHEGRIFYTAAEILELEAVHSTIFTAIFYRNLHDVHFGVSGDYLEGGTIEAFYDNFEGTRVAASPAQIVAGNAIALRAEPAEGYEIYQWLVNGLTVGNNQDAISLQQWLQNTINPGNAMSSRFTGDELIVSDIRSYTTIYVQFRPMPEVDYVIDGAGTVTGQVVGSTTVIDRDGTQVPYGSDVLFNFTADTGYRLARWYINGRLQINPPVGNSLLVRNVTEDTTVRVVFVPIYHIVEFDVESGAGTITAVQEMPTGTDVAVTSPADVRHGQTVTFTATPEEGYTINRWYVNGEVVTNATDTTLTRTITADTEVLVVFAPLTPTVTFAVESGAGTITAVREVPAGADIAITSPANVNHGTTVTFTATPEEGYTVSRWYINGEVVTNEAGTTLTRTITADTEVLVVFVRDLIEVTFGIDAGEGTIVANVTGGETSPISVAYGSDVTFTATPATGYSVEGWLVDGVLVTGEVGTTFTLENVTAATLVEVRFVADDVEYTLIGGRHIRVAHNIVDFANLEAWLITEANVNAHPNGGTVGSANSDLIVTITDFAGNEVTSVASGQFLVTFALPTSTGVTPVTIVLTIVAGR